MNRDEDINWFHGKISRENAENILMQDPNREDGLFLVRESNTSSRDFVLSVYSQEKVIHFQIRRHTDDAFFSIDEFMKFHGLESLIEHLCYSPDTLDDGLILTRYVPGGPPPHDSRRHGRTNLLHRATSHGNFTVVSELLKAGYRHEAKNQDGQTAVHLASMAGKNDILQKLIEHNANVNLRDTAGLTPLHYACQNNLPATVRLLVQIGGANIQARNTENNEVPLHEAAKKGYKDVIKELLSLNAPAFPRNSNNKVPSQLARENGHIECAEILEKYEPPRPKTDKSKWYHGTLDRQEAEALIREFSMESGTYLVRFSDRNGENVLTLLNEKTFFNYIIMRHKDGTLYIDNGPYLQSLEHVIEYYSFIPDGLPTVLQTPVPPKPKPPVPFNTMPRPKKKTSEPKKTSQLHNISFSPNFTKSLNNNNNNLEKDYYIPPERLVKGSIIGEGEFASVYEGKYMHPNGDVIDVAIKILRDDQVGSSKDAFLREADVMLKLNHYCIVKLIGMSYGPPLLMVQELIALGSMLHYIENHLERIRPNYEFKIWAAQIAGGMKYLEEHRFIHRDLAARNILLASPIQAKISDFGLSRLLRTDHDYYRALEGGKWPLKWYAPESYNYGEFTHKSDVWSFGVTIWEMYSFGKVPYGEMKGAEAINLINEGKRLEQPETCPDDVYQVMLRCWDFDVNKRPDFCELVEFFSSDSDYMNIREALPDMNL